MAMPSHIFSLFSPKSDKKWVLACQSFGECTARVKLELTDFGWLRSPSLSALQKVIFFCCYFLTPFSRLSKFAKFVGKMRLTPDSKNCLKTFERERKQFIRPIEAFWAEWNLLGFIDSRLNWFYVTSNLQSYSFLQILNWFENSIPLLISQNEKIRTWGSLK